MLALGASQNYVSDVRREEHSGACHFVAAFKEFFKEFLLLNQNCLSVDFFLLDLGCIDLSHSYKLYFLPF